MKYIYELSSKEGTMIATGECESTDYFEVIDIVYEHIEDVDRINDVGFNEVTDDYADYSPDVRFIGNGSVKFRCIIKLKGKL